MGATAAAVGEKRGILFGPERTGLDNDEVAIADAIVTFPSSPAYASLNLSQAVLLCGYEWFKAAHGDAPPPPTVPRPLSPPAQREMLLAFFDYLEEQARRERLFPPGHQEAGHAAKPAQHFHRMEPTQQDVRHCGARGSPGRGAADRGQDAQARAAEKAEGDSRRDANRRRRFWRKKARQTRSCLESSKIARANAVPRSLRLHYCGGSRAGAAIGPA